MTCAVHEDICTVIVLTMSCTCAMHWDNDMGKLILEFTHYNTVIANLIDPKFV